MRTRTVAILLVALGVVALAGGWYFGTRTMPAEQTRLAGRQADVPRSGAEAAATRPQIEVIHQGKHD